MKKDAFYFPHFANARHDRKLKRVQKEMGLEGYAIYFMLLEVLREQLDFKYPLSDLDLLADEFGTSEAKVNVVVNNYDLFILDDEHNFFSIKQIYYLQPYIEKTERARLAAQKRWNLVNDDANAMQMHSKSNANAMQVKESKVKQSKQKDRKVLFRETQYQNLDDYRNAFIGTIYENANHNYYHEVIRNWSDANNEKKIDWIATAKNWMARDIKEGKFVDQNFKPNERGTNQNRKPTYAEQQSIDRRNL